MILMKLPIIVFRFAIVSYLKMNDKNEYLFNSYTKFTVNCPATPKSASLA